MYKVVLFTIRNRTLKEVKKGRKCISNLRGAQLGGAAGALAPPIILDFTK